MSSEPSVYNALTNVSNVRGHIEVYADICGHMWYRIFGLGFLRCVGFTQSNRSRPFKKGESTNPSGTRPFFYGYLGYSTQL